MSPPNADDFENNLRLELGALEERVIAENGDWTVKGFIDVYKRIYTITLDTKVLSKVLELLMFPVLESFAKKKGFKILHAREQNHYPDLTLVHTDGRKYAVDIKSTYRDGVKAGSPRVSGMTLGTFMGYFRDRTNGSGCTLPYGDYDRHYVLGVVYSQVKGIQEGLTYNVRSLLSSDADRRQYEDMRAQAEAEGDEFTLFVDDLASIPSVAKEFEFFLQEKYRIAADRTGSGNTNNIGSTTFLDRMVNGTGGFASFGVAVFDDYWTNYRTKAMAKAEGMPGRPYKNLLEYRAHAKIAEAVLAVPEVDIVSEESSEAGEDG